MFRFMKNALVIGVSCLYFSTFLVGCSSKPVLSSSVDMPPGGGVVYLALLPVAPFMMAANTLEEVVDEAVQGNISARERREAAIASCPEGYGDFCRRFTLGGRNLKKLAAKLEAKKPFPLDDPRTYYMLGLLASVWHSNAEELAAFAEPLPSSASQSDILFRAALLRGSLESGWGDEKYKRREALEELHNTREQREAYREAWSQTDSGGDEAKKRYYEAWNSFKKAEKEMKSRIENEMRRRPVPPTPAYQALAARLLEIDQRLLAERPNKALDAVDELVFAIDFEFMAWFSPENEFQPWADKAKEHYLNVIRKTSTPLATVALLRYDILAAGEAQRVAAVRLYIKSGALGNSGWGGRGLAALSRSELTLGRALQPGMIERIEAKKSYVQSAKWLDENLQKGRENKEISALLAETGYY